MYRRGCFLRASCIAALAMLVVGTGPAAAAGNLFLRNDTSVPLIVQGVSINNPNGKATRRLFPRDVASFPVVQPGVKVISIYDQRLQLKAQVPVNVAPGQNDLFFSIQVHQGNKVILKKK